MPRRVPSVKQATFVGGEVSPDLYGREDLARYGQSAARMQNWFVAPTGALKNRPGTAFVREVKDSTDRCRLIPFIVSKTASYVLELGDLYIRFHKDGATILDGTPYEVVTPWPAADLPDIKFAQRSDVMILVHPLHPPQELRRFADANWELVEYSTNKTVEPPIDVILDPAYTWTVEAAPTHTFSLWEWVVTAVSLTGEESIASEALTESQALLYSDRPKPTIQWTAAATGSTPVRYNIYRGRHGVFGYVGSSTTTSFIDEAALPDYALVPPEANSPFEFTPVDGTEFAYPHQLYVGLHTTGAASATLQDTGRTWTVNELVDAFVRNLTDASNGVCTANTATVVTAPLAGGTDNLWDVNDQYGIVGMRAIKAQAAEAFDDTYNLFSVIHIAVGGTADIAYESRLSGGGWTTHATITYGPGVNADVQSFVRDGLVALAEFRVRIVSETGLDNIQLGHVQWYTSPAPTVTTNFPSSVTFFEQRLVFGGMFQEPQRITGSAAGTLRDFDKRDVPTEADSWDFTLDANTLDEVRALISHKALLILTASSEWVGRGVEGGPLTNTSFDLKPRTRTGTSGVQPVAIDSGVLFTGERGRSVHEMTWAVWDEAGGTSSSAPELSLIAEHLFREYGIEEWAWQPQPGRILWSVRADGVLVGMTLNREQEILAWHRHTTGLSSADDFESVAVVPEGGEWVPYVIVERTINAATVRYVERMASRTCPIDADVPTADSLLFLDSALMFDGRNTGSNTLRVTGGTTWLAGEAMQLQSLISQFAAGDVGDDYELTIGSDTVRFRVTGFTSVQEVDVEPATNVPIGMQGSPGPFTVTWGHGFPDFSGLTHLEGATVGLLVDGNDGGVAVVASGAITLPSSLRGILVQVGLPIPTAVVESLPLSAGQDPSMRTAQKMVETIGLELADWRGMEVGPDVDHLYDVQEREVELSFSTIQPDHGIVVVPSASTWQRQARFAVRQSAPLPATLLSVIVGLRAGGNL